MHYTIYGSNNALNPLEKAERGIKENMGLSADVWNLIYDGSIPTRAKDALVNQSKRNYKIVQVFKGKNLGKLDNTYW